MASATSYVIDELIDGAWEQIATVGNETSYSMAGFIARATYQFRVAQSMRRGRPGRLPSPSPSGLPVSPSCQVDSRHSNTTYDFRLGSFNANGTSWTNAQSATTLPAAPTLTVQAISSTQVDLSWNSVAGRVSM